MIKHEPICEKCKWKAKELFEASIDGQTKLLCLNCAPLKNIRRNKENPVTTPKLGGVY